MNDWAVYRLDYNNNEYLVEKGLSQPEANRLAAEYIAKGHHQHYWVDKEPADSPDFQKMMTGMLESGSSPQMAARVLITQGATPEVCIELLQTCCGFNVERARAVVSEVSKD